MANKVWAYARRWHNENFVVVPSLDLLLNGLRLFVLEKEPPDDLKKHIYRSGVCCIYSIFDKTGQR